MRITRELVEMNSRSQAGVIDETEEWYKVTVLGSIQMYCRKDDASITPHLKAEGFWESWITSWVLNEVDDETLFVDVGANTGYYTLAAITQGAKVVAFEPNPKYVEMLEQSLRLDGNAGSATVQQWAVSNELGHATLTIPKALQGSATITSEIDQELYPSDTISVLTTTLDRIFSPLDKQKMVIKIDAESAEELIWDGMQEVLEKHEPTIILEYTPGAYGRDFLNKLESYADLAWVNHSGEEELITQNSILSNADWIMLVLRKRN